MNPDPNAWLTAAIREFCRGPANNLGDGRGEPAWAEPLVGFSRGDDPLYVAYKEYVGPFHWTPWEIFTATFPDVDVAPADLSVISWVLPQTGITKDDNCREKVYPAERWARSRIYGEQFNAYLRGRVVEFLAASGIPAVAPLLSPQWHQAESDRYVYASTWSERHAAYASGLGTFGLCDGLITAAGKAMRAGSVVARLRVEPSGRPYADHHAYCLFFANGTCAECIARCPVGAITEAGHDKRKCSAHLDRTKTYVKTTYGFDGYGCGLCQTGVPCESRIPEGLGTPTHAD